MTRWRIGDGVQLVAGRAASPFRRDDLCSQVASADRWSRSRAEPSPCHLTWLVARCGMVTMHACPLPQYPIIPRRVHCAARAAFIPARLGFISSSDDSSSVPVYMY